MIKKIFDLYKKYKEIINYLIFGVLTTVISILSYYLLKKIGLTPYPSEVLSWIISVTFAFITNKLLVFESKDKSFKTFLVEGVKFYGARILSLLLDLALFFLLYNVCHINDMIVKIIVNIVVIVVNYILSKFLVFNKK